MKASDLDEARKLRDLTLDIDAKVAELRKCEIVTVEFASGGAGPVKEQAVKETISSGALFEALQAATISDLLRMRENQKKQLEKLGVEL